MTIDPFRFFPGYALRRASSASVADLVARLEAFDLSTTEAAVLVVISANRHITQSVISRMLDIASANLTPLVARLDERGLIKRARVDGRTQSLELTRAGRVLAAKGLKEMQAHERGLIERVPPHLREGFVEALTVIWRPNSDT